MKILHGTNSRIGDHSDFDPQCAAGVGPKCAAGVGPKQLKFRLWLSGEIHERCDQGISFGFVVIRALDTKTPSPEIAGECPAQIAEGVFGAFAGRLPSCRGLESVRAVDPGEGGRRHAEVPLLTHICQPTPAFQAGSTVTH